MSVAILDIISKDLAEDLCLTDEYHPKEPVTFRLIRANSVDPTSNRIVTPSAHILPGKDMIKDPYDKRQKNKLIRNIVGYNPVAAKPGQDPALDPIEDYFRFDSSGEVIVQPGDLDKWLFAKLHNKNRDNPNRNVLKPAVFYEVNEAKELTAANNSFMFRHLASSIVIDAGEDPDLLHEIGLKVRALYPAYQVDVNVDAEKLIGSLVAIAESNPAHVILSVKEPNSLARLLAEEAVKRRTIFFDDHEEKLQWNWRRGTFDKGKKIIVKLEAGNTPIKGLVDFLTSKDGSEHFAELKKLGEEYYPKPR